MNFLRHLFFCIFFCTGFLAELSAQSCVGSLGDAIVNIDFGRGNNYGPALPAGSTSIVQYVTNECPNDGYYTIVSSTSNCFGGNWQSLKDHTGNGNGYFMLVNASYEPSNFFIRKINGLCPGTTYEFAAWLVNVLSVSGIHPNITFTIERENGEVLMSYDTGDLLINLLAPWQQYGAVFTTPSDVSTVILRMRNNAPGGNGNDIGLDDITFRPTGPAIDVEIEGYGADTLVICPDNRDIFQLNAVIDPCYISAAYQWQESTDNGISWQNIPGETTPSFTRLPTLTPGVYLYRIAVAQTGNIDISTCRVVSKPLGISILPTPLPVLVAPGYICKGDSVLLTPGVFDTYLWQDGSTGSGFMVKTGGLYSVTVGNGCELVSAFSSIDERVCGFFFPSAFTPNSDGKNETFKILSSYTLSYYQLEVYNRWGQKVFSTNDVLQGWDGKVRGNLSPNDTYIWKADMQVAGKNERVHRNGTLQLVR